MPPPTPARWFRLALALPPLLTPLALPRRAVASLAPDQIALVVNANVPASRELAEFYAQRRGIPAGRIIALDLPFPEEEIAFERYDAAAAPAVRKFLRDAGLRDKVACLVTFWGVPLRIGRRTASSAEREQLAVVQRELDKAKTDLESAVGQAEALARELDPNFQPPKGRELNQLAQRAGESLTAAVRATAVLTDEQKRADVAWRLPALLDSLVGRSEATQRLSAPGLATLVPDRVTPEQVARAKNDAAARLKEFNALKLGPQTPQAFEAMRLLVRENFGLFRYIELVGGQYATYETKETESAFDSELALLWWEKPYPRYRWQMNALNYKVHSIPPGTPTTLMVMRLDGPTEQSADRIILSSLKAEKLGLKGQVVLDGRGMKGDDGYGKYDTTIRNLAALLREKTKLQVTFDDTDTLIQPGPDAPKDVAVYCGWYSLRNYVPAMKFSEGAVGFHVASSELVSLRTPGERGWVKGLIDDGVVATLGPVAEPYLQSFPPADEFFPLLMTGKLTLAEAYWKTTPLTSWMITCVGDPLYTPYKIDPPLKVEDLPEKLQAAVVPGAPAPQRPVGR